MLSLIFLCFQLLKSLVGKSIEPSCFTPEICRAYGGQCPPYLALINTLRLTGSTWLRSSIGNIWSRCWCRKQGEERWISIS